MHAQQMPGVHVGVWHSIYPVSTSHVSATHYLALCFPQCSYIYKCQTLLSSA